MFALHIFALQNKKLDLQLPLKIKNTTGRCMQNYMLGLCLLSTSATAQMLIWIPNTPSSLAPFQQNSQRLASLTANNVLIYAHPSQLTQLPTFKAAQPRQAQYTSAAVILPTDIDTVRRLLSQPENYVGLFPSLKKAERLEQSGNMLKMKYQVHIPTPIPVLNFKENIVMQHHITENSIHSLILDAPIPYAAGQIEWFFLSPHQTLVTITQWGDLNQPRGFLFSKILNALPEAKLGIPAGTNAFFMEALQQRFKANEINKPRATTSHQLPRQQQEWVAELSQKSKQPVTFMLPNQTSHFQNTATNMRFSSSYHYYPNPEQQLQPWIGIKASQQLFPRQVKHIEIRPTQNQSQIADYKVSVGLGVIHIPFNFKMNVLQANPSQTEFEALDGDLKFVKAKMQLRPFKQGTLFQMSSAVKIHDQAPFLLRAMRSMPYHDVLPAVGANTVYALKVQQNQKDQLSRRN